MKDIIFTCSDAIRIAAILLQPFMPSKMKTTLDILGVDESKRTFIDAKFRADYSYGVPLIEVGKRIGYAGNTLFPPLMAEV